MNLQAKKLNDLELESISGGEHKQISVLSLKNVRENGFHPASNQTYFVDDNGNYHVTTIYTDKEWADKEAIRKAIRIAEETKWETIKAKRKSEDKVTLYVGASVCAVVVFGFLAVYYAVYKN